MDVHIPEAGDDELAGAIDVTGVGRDFGVGCGTDGGDFFAVDQDDGVCS